MLLHSNSTRPLGMSISWATPDRITPRAGPPTWDRSVITGRLAVTSAVFCGLTTNSCRSAWSPSPALTVARVRYDVSAMIALPSPVPLVICPSHQVSTGWPR